MKKKNTKNSKNHHRRHEGRLRATVTPVVRATILITAAMKTPPPWEAMSATPAVAVTRTPCTTTTTTTTTAVVVVATTISAPATAVKTVPTTMHRHESPDVTAAAAAATTAVDRVVRPLPTSSRQQPVTAVEGTAATILLLLNRPTRPCPNHPPRRRLPTGRRRVSDRAIRSSPRMNWKPYWRRMHPILPCSKTPFRGDCNDDTETQKRKKGGSPWRGKHMGNAFVSDAPCCFARPCAFVTSQQNRFKHSFFHLFFRGVDREKEWAVGQRTCIGL